MFHVKHFEKMLFHKGKLPCFDAFGGFVHAAPGDPVIIFHRV